MSQNDFQSAFRDEMIRQVPSSGLDSEALASRLLRRDLHRTRLLAGASLFCWMVGAAGMILLLVGLNRFIIGVRIEHLVLAGPAAARGVDGQNASNDMQQWILQETDLLHHSMPYVAASVLALLLAALFTVLLILASRQATLNRVNLSLNQISMEIARLHKPDIGPGSGNENPPMTALHLNPYTPPGTPSQRHRVGLWAGSIVALLAIAFAAGLWAVYLSAARHTLRWSGYPRLSPFQAIHWDSQSPDVRVEGHWYKLRAINGVPVAQIVAFSQAEDTQTWQKHFNEDLVELLTLMGHSPARVATLDVEDETSGREQSLTGVPMTEANRHALWMSNAMPQVPTSRSSATMPR